MKIHGKKPGVFTDVVAFPLGEGGHNVVVFKLVPPDDLNDYEKQWPAPKPPMKTEPGKKPVPYLEDKNYKIEMSQWIGRKYDWIYVTTLRNTPGLEWEKVKLADIMTYTHWQSELMELGLTVPMWNHLYSRILAVNGLDDAKLAQAREDFLKEEAEARRTQSSQVEDQNVT